MRNSVVDSILIGVTIVILVMGPLFGSVSVPVSGTNDMISREMPIVPSIEGGISSSRALTWGKIATVTNTIDIPPGEKYYVYFDNNTKTLKKMDLTDPLESLPSDVQNAIAKVPNWLKQNLTRKFVDLGSTDASTYADLINNPGNNKYIDEIAFTIAHTSAELLKSSEVYPVLFKKNVEYLYANDPFIDFADIVEYSNYSTVRYYVNESGTINSYELPKEIYYWYIVHPKVNMETPTYIDPDTGGRAPPPTGKFWRDYLFNHADPAYPSPNTGPVKYPIGVSPPLLKDLISGVNTVWNCTKYEAPDGYDNDGLNNQRPFGFGDHAVEKVSNWVCKTLPLNVQDESDRIGSFERPSQPVRIAHNHYGNCGELMDLTTAAARTCLIPVRSVFDLGEDHVWQEFWERGWHHWDNWWSDSGSGIDIPEWLIARKTARPVFIWKGNDYSGEQSKLYSPTVTLEITVLDANDYPVDGAQVLLANTWSGNILVSMGNHTNCEGKCGFRVGDGTVTYYARVDSMTLGSDPSDPNQVKPIVASPVAGQTYSLTLNLPNAKSKPKLPYNPATYPSNPRNEYKMDMNFDVHYTTTHSLNWLFWRNGAQRHYYEPNHPMGIDFCICDSANFEKYTADGEFDAYEILGSKVSGEATFVIPTDDTWYIILSNEDAISTYKNLTVTVDLYSLPRISIISPELNSVHALGSETTIQGIASGPQDILLIEIDIDNKNDWQQATDTSTTVSWSSWSYIWDTQEFGLGKHSIRAKLTDSEGICITEINITLLDLTKPEVSITVPRPYASFKIGETVRLEGTAFDNCGIITIETFIDGGNPINITSDYNEAKGIWIFDWGTTELSEGEHNITIRIIDIGKNEAYAIIIIILLENVVPIVNIQTPDNNSLWTLGTTVFIAGTATDNKAVIFVELIIDDNDPFNITSNYNPSTEIWMFNWDTNMVGIEEGGHNITVRVADAARNYATSTISITLDGTPPTVSIINPHEGELFAVGAIITIHGTASDNFNLAMVELSIDDERAMEVTSSLHDGKWSYDWDTTGLSGGEYIINIIATDSVGHETIVTASVTLDGAPPTIYITDLIDFFIIGDTVTIKGMAMDEIGVGTIELMIDYGESINITSNYTAEGWWSYNWDTSGVTEVVHDITIVAIDLVGNQASCSASIRGVSLTTDRDEDGIPDWWELKYELDPDDANDVNLDKDDDGYTNLQEYLGDDGKPGGGDWADPTDPESRPKFKPQEKESDYTNTIILIGALATVIVVIIVVLIIFFLIVKKKKKKEETKKEPSAPGQYGDPYGTKYGYFGPPQEPLPRNFPKGGVQDYSLGMRYLLGPQQELQPQEQLPLQQQLLPQPFGTTTPIAQEVPYVLPEEEQIRVQEAIYIEEKTTPKEPPLIPTGASLPSTTPRTTKEI